MTTRRNISSVITTVYFVLLLYGTLSFTPDIFVNRYITHSQLSPSVKIYVYETSETDSISGNH